MALFEGFGRKSSTARALAAIVCILITVRYAYWRVAYSIPTDQTPLQMLWIYSFLGVEMAVLVSTVLVYFFMSRTVSRSAEADAVQSSPLLGAPTDVFIATCNESVDIIERTTIGALTIDHPDLRVWILDDGDRPWVRELAESLGVHYVARNKGKHAKAGNVNNGVGIALKTGRRPKFFLLLDADFVPNRNILRRTLGLFEDASVGIIQTPQHFFNSDPVQSNLLCSRVWPDEQRFFFNVLLPSKDAWGAAFCCGTSAVFRIDAFVAAGGMSVETVTEDMLTSFRFREFGYRTILLNERLSLGLAPESLGEFITQRSRWCLGAIQQIFTPWSFFGSARISLINRLSFFDTILYWMFAAVFKIMLVLFPIVYWFTGTSPVNATGSDMIVWLVPMLLANLIFMYYVTGNRILPIMSDITQLLTVFTICRTLATALIRPFGRPFKVTAKGLVSSGYTVQWRIMAPYLALAGATLIGVLMHVSEFSEAHGTPGYSMCVLFSLVNAAVLCLAALACIEPPRLRRDERFHATERVVIRLPSDTGEPIEIRGAVRDISLGGAAVLYVGDSNMGWRSVAGPAQLVIHSKADGTDLALPFTVIDRRDGLMTVRFHDEAWIRHALIRKLFTGDYHHDVEEINATAVFAILGRNLFF